MKLGGSGGLVAELCLTLATLLTVAHHVPLSMGFSRQKYWSGLLFPPPEHLPNLGIEPRSLKVSCIGWWVLLPLPPPRKPSFGQ